MHFLKKKYDSSFEQIKLDKISKIGIIVCIIECATLDLASNNIILSLILLIILIRNKEERGCCIENKRNEIKRVSCI